MALHLGPVNVALSPDGEQTIELGPATLKSAALWHFDAPHLYELVIELDGPSGVHQLIEYIRNSQVRGSR